MKMNQTMEINQIRMKRTTHSMNQGPFHIEWVQNNEEIHFPTNEEYPESK